MTKKILIISYFYPPANFVGGDRVASWAKYLHESGIYPIIITRQWNEGQIDLVDKVNHNQLEVERNGTHEVHRLPFRRSLRDKCASYNWLKPVQKTLTLFELITSHFSVRYLPYSNFYSYSKQLIKNDPSISIVLASGRPFQSFAIGHQLKKDFPALNWIPDYRDEWTTRVTNQPTGILNKLLFWLDTASELRWTNNACFFITVSELWRNNITQFIQQPGNIVMNGFEPIEDHNPSISPVKNDKLTILYVGTLYPYQNIEILLESIHQLKEEIVLNFIGSDVIPSEQRRLKQLRQQYPFILITPRIDRAELNKFLKSADVFFATSYSELKGCIPVKLFEYYNTQKPVLLCPSDNDVMETFILETRSGFVANTLEECTNHLKRLITDKQQSKSPILRNTEAGKKYSRQNQSHILGRLLNTLN